MSDKNLRQLQRRYRVGSIPLSHYLGSLERVLGLSIYESDYSIPEEWHGFLTYQSLLNHCLGLTNEQLAMVATHYNVDSDEYIGLTGFGIDNSESALDANHPVLITHHCNNCGRSAPIRISQDWLDYEEDDVPSWIENCGHCNNIALYNRNPSSYHHNPLDTSGLICDFCTNPGVTEIHSCVPFQMGDRMRGQFMSCPPCSQFIADRNIRALITQAANMLPPTIPRKMARIHFRKIYLQVFKNLLDTRTIEPEHIFDLQMLRARARAIKCQLRTGHPTLGACTDLAYLEVNFDNSWHKCCLPCGSEALGLPDAQELILHPQTRTLRG